MPIRVEVNSIRGTQSRTLPFQVWFVVILVALACAFLVPANSGIRGPGKYCGVVVFDHWDTCYLLSGPYVMYISESVKNDLRPYDGKAIQIDALVVYQPQNPGDGLIKKYKIIGEAPINHKNVEVEGLVLSAKSDFGSRGAPRFFIEIRNGGSTSIEIGSSQIGPTLLGPAPKSPFEASDGASTAVITRGSLVHRGSAVWESKMDGVRTYASYAIDRKSQPPDSFALAPGQSRIIRITLRVPPGQYQFLFGYGGGVHEEKSLASNSVMFNLSKMGVATLTK